MHSTAHDEITRHVAYRALHCTFHDCAAHDCAGAPSPLFEAIRLQLCRATAAAEQGPAAAAAISSSFFPFDVEYPFNFIDLGTGSIAKVASPFSCPCDQPPLQRLAHAHLPMAAPMAAAVGPRGAAIAAWVTTRGSEAFLVPSPRA